MKLAGGFNIMILQKSVIGEIIITTKKEQEFLSTDKC